MSAYSAAVLADSPRHYWRCADPGGALFHDIGSAPIALLLNGNFPAGLPYTGPVSDGGAFTSQGLAYPWFNQNSDPFAPPMSLEVWAWQHSDIAIQQLLLVVSGGTTVAFLDVNASVQLGAHGPSGSVVDAAAFTRQKWHHVVMTLSAGGTLDLYKDAILVGTAAAGVMNTQNYRYAVGGNTNSGANFFQGALSEAAVYPSVLSPARVTAHFTAADAVSSTPVFQVPGSTAPFATLNEILAAVQKTFPAT